MAFLNTLGSSLLSSLNSSAGFAGNSPLGLGAPLPFGTGAQAFGTQNAFSVGVENNTQRQYIEDGIVSNVRPRNTEIIMQTPDITVLVKKRQFASLAENYRFDLMESDERLFIRCVKRLFYNKCAAIAAYEQLTKLEQIVINSGGVVNDTMLPAILSASDTLNFFVPGLIDSTTQSTLETIRKIKQFSDPNQTTTWITEQTPVDPSLGEGTGVMELTNVQSLSCTNTVKFMAGNASLSIEDPYKLMVMTRHDIERAIIEAVNAAQMNGFFTLTAQTLTQTISDLQSQLSQLRASRGAPDIDFIVNSTTSLPNKIRAIIDSVGIEINYTFSAGVLGIGSSVSLDASAKQGPLGLQGQESDLFQQIVQNSYTLMALQQTTNNQMFNFNKTTNNIRQRMMLEFGNKPIIQPMDVIHIFIATKTIIDPQVVHALTINFSGNSLLNNINNAITNVENSVNSLFGSFSGLAGGNNFIQTEKDVLVGQDFPLWLWSLMRNDFTRQAAGTHVFAGIVSEASHSYEGGKYNLRVGAKDQANYFDLGQINVKPSLDVFDSSLYDPLTPFDISFDASSGFVNGGLPKLLDENIALLGSGSLKAKLGRFRGSVIDQTSYQITDAEKMASNLFRRKLNDPDGLVYRWKRGIGSLTMFGQPHDSATFASETSPALTRSPFAGQDVMNVLSLLITGQPYNFNTFLKASLASNGLNKDTLFNQNGAASFLRGLINDLTKNNQTWGNFVPFKKMVINDSAYQFLISGQFDISNSNQRVTQLLNQRAQRFDELTAILPQFANNPQFYNGITPINTANLGAIDVNSLATLGADIIQLDGQINSQVQALQNSLQNPNLRSSQGTLNIFGNDISFDPSTTGGSGLTVEQTAQDQKDLRQKTNYLTQRLLWKVKSNTDPNLFIVDDSYDKNYDIQAFNTALGGSLDTFKSTYSKVSDLVDGVAQLLGLEIFADSQGHIQARPPQYNRMPMSVFNNMLNSKNTNGTQLFPDFLESLFINQVDSLVDQIQITEDQIRIRAAALGYTSDSSAQTLLRGAVSGSGGSNVSFTFVTDETTGQVGGTDIRNLLMQSSPDLMQDSQKQALNILTSSITGPANATINFDIVQQVSVINKQQFPGISAQGSVDDAITRIGARLQQGTQQPAPTKQTLLPHGSTLSGYSQLDVLNLTQQISQFVAERQTLIKSLTNAVKNLNQGLQLNTNSLSSGVNVLFPGLSNISNSTLPPVIEHMLEDETFDDYGVNSGQRYIIKDSNVISLSVGEMPPPWTLVEVDGALAGGLVDGPSGLQIGDGGNGISTAFAVDYDMWRLYGFRAPHVAQVPYLSDPESQLAPYAVFLLNKARKDIFHGQATCIGNEFMQAGEVYYIEDRDLLFYAESVTHSFSYGQQYTTSLSLTFGHNPGEYIPTMLDVIGKGLYTNKSSSNLVRHVRHNTANEDIPLHILVNDPNVFSFGLGSGLDQLLSGAYGTQNSNNLNDLVTNFAGTVAPTTSNDQISIEVRVYYNSAAGFSSADSNLQSMANSVLSWLKNPSQSSGIGSIIPSGNAPTGIDPSKISVVTVDIGDPNETRSSPSSQAWSMARSLVLTGGTSITVSLGPLSASAGPQITGQAAMQSLFSNVIDVWATFAPPQTGTIANSTSKNPTTDQSAQQQSQQYIANFNKSLGIS